MNLLFCHDGPIEKINNEYYGIGFNDELFERYKVIADNISIAIRVHENNDYNFDKNKYLKLSNQYRIIECPNMSTIKEQIFKNKCLNILKKEIESTDLIIIRLPSFIGNIAVSICKKYNKKYYVELVGCPWDALWNHSFIGKTIAPLMYFRTKENVRDAFYVQYVTNEFLQKRYPTKGKYIGCSDVKLSNCCHKKNYKKLLDLKKLTIGTLGVLNVKYKGQEYVIMALEKLKKKGYDIKYELVGAGNNERLKKIAIKHNVIDNISFLGPMKHEDVFKWLEKIDIYIQPSTTEGMPRSLIEAMSVGCLCMSSNVGGMPELLEKKYVFKPKSYKQICDIILSLKIENYNEQSVVNYNNSKKFLKNILNSRRNEFLKKYKKEIIFDEGK